MTERNENFILKIADDQNFIHLRALFWRDKNINWEKRNSMEKSSIRVGETAKNFESSHCQSAYEFLEVFEIEVK